MEDDNIPGNMLGHLGNARTALVQLRYTYVVVV
jgi:hypothetical protein